MFSQLLPEITLPIEYAYVIGRSTAHAFRHVSDLARRLATSRRTFGLFLGDLSMTFDQVEYSDIIGAVC